MVGKWQFALATRRCEPLSTLLPSRMHYDYEAE